MAEEGVCQYHQQELWGLDYYLRVYNKMYIQDVLALRLYPHCIEAFAYKNHPIHKVDVLGVVVHVDERDRCFIYAIDDGTGVISCCCWKPDRGHSGDETMYSTLPVSLQKKVCDIQDEEKQATSGYSHGDLVHIKGKVKVFREVNEITALYHAKVDNPAAEIVRMVELPKLYKMCYDKPFELPHRVRADLDMAREEDTTGVKSCKRILQEVGVAVSEHLRTAPSVREFTASQMCRLATVTAILAQQQSLDEKQSPISMVTQALKKLEEEAGTVCRRMEASALYENLNHSRALKEAILNVLVKESQKPKYSERGCHYLHILDELHRTAQYSKLHQTALLHCLQALETQSDVIRTYHKQYLPCVT
ncbi:CST complex subunit STN1-like isoform X2 [Haliotis rufescens]|uniref:CST complex subunit STN1-like isoform X2 n=2 Tax=Haliotis rufescens TaxID=6454 RepID=UPI00201EB119|nr:CST complex subunit STN1-like isoform X2 [Haliotis rufescens]XP_046365719.2 CST complex subunit STN1-like isoform X2 [Haliotis rufescens]